MWGGKGVPTSAAIKGEYNLTRTGAIIRATIFGNDYYKGVPGVGPKTFASIQAIHKGDIASMLTALENIHPDFLPNYNRLKNIYSHPPVFEVSLNGDKIVPTGKMIPLSKQDLSCEIWKSLIEFDPHQPLY